MKLWRARRRACVLIADALEREKRPPFIAAIALTDTTTRAALQPNARTIDGDFLGINRVWVHPVTRRRGVAKLLIRGARTFADVRDVSRLLIAFNDPIGVGQALAISILGHKDENYLTYDEEEEITS